MTTSGNIEQKVRQLDNDVHAIYGMLPTIGITQERHTNRLAEITEDTAAIKADVGELRTDVGGLRTDVGELRTDVGGLRTDVGELKTNMARVLEILERSAD